MTIWDVPKITPKNAGDLDKLSIPEEWKAVSTQLCYTAVFGTEARVRPVAAPSTCFLTSLPSNIV